MYDTFIALAIVISLIYLETTSISPGGLITPGYLALFVDQPVHIGATLVISFLSYACVQVLNHFFPMDSRRRFAAAIIFAVLFKQLMIPLGLNLSLFSIAASSIGVIIPGLIAHDMLKQGIMKTLLSLLLVTAALYALLLILQGMQL